MLSLRLLVELHKFVLDFILYWWGNVYGNIKNKKITLNTDWFLINVAMKQAWWNGIDTCFHTIIRSQVFFFYQGFISRTLTTHMTAGEGRAPFLFHSTTSTRSRTFRHLFATLHARWLSHIFDRTACIYQAATRFGLPPMSFVYKT